MNKNKFIPVIIGLSICILLLVGILVGSIVFKGDSLFNFWEEKEMNLVKEESFDIEQLHRLNFSLISSDVSIRETDGNEIVVRQYASKKLKEDEIFSSSVSGDELTIKERRKHYFVIFSFGFYSNHFEILIPKEYADELKVVTVSGDIDFQSDWHFKDCELKSTSGDIGTRGSLTVDSNLVVTTVSGEITLRQASSKNINFKSTSGDIEADRLVGNLTAKTISGEMDFGSLEGTLNATLTSGDISVDHFLMNQDSKIKTVSGEVTIDINPASNIEIRSDSVSGDISLPNHSSVIGSSPYKTFQINTTSGDIRITKKTS